MLPNCRSLFLLDRLGRCLELFISYNSTSCHESQFGLAIFYTRKTSKTSGKSGRRRVCFLNDPATGHECQRNRRKWALISSRLDATDTSNLNGDGSVCACACGCVCLCERAYMRVCACVMCLQYTILIFHPG